MNETPEHLMAICPAALIEAFEKGTIPEGITNRRLYDAWRKTGGMTHAELFEELAKRQANYKPAEFKPGTFTWFSYLQGDCQRGPHVLPPCYFKHLKAGKPYREDPMVTSVVRQYTREADALADLRQAIDAFEGEPRLGTPISELIGPPGSFAHERFCRIAESWGHG